MEEKEVSSGRKGSLQPSTKTEPMSLQAIENISEKRTSTGIQEFDRVLGGGVVAGSVILVGGDPGIGKSTLLLQAFSGLSRSTGKLLYVSGEESPQQIKMRAERLSVNAENIILLQIIQELVIDRRKSVTLPTISGPTIQSTAKSVSSIRIIATLVSVINRTNN